MKQLISALLLIGCLVACDPSPCTEAIEAPQETTKPNPMVTSGRDCQDINFITVHTSDPSDQFEFSVYQKNKIEDDKYSMNKIEDDNNTILMIFLPKDEVQNGDLEDQYQFTAMINPGHRGLKNKIVIRTYPARNHNNRYVKCNCRLEYFQNREALNNYTNETDDMIVGVCSKKYTENNILFDCDLRPEI